MRRSLFFIMINGCLLLLLLGLFLKGRQVRAEQSEREGPAQLALVKNLRLTDLALWTEARYTRHPSQADFFAPFQDMPSSLEHFPAGSVVQAPSFTEAKTQDKK